MGEEKRDKNVTLLLLLILMTNVSPLNLWVLIGFIKLGINKAI